jgi:hypothetical protein
MTYHKTEYHAGHFEETLTIYYRYRNADLLADEKFQMAVQEIKHEIYGPQSFAVFPNPTLKVTRCLVYNLKKLNHTPFFN